jgi:hypothetical protein
MRWSVVLIASGLFANRARDGGTLKPFLESAGFPWVYAFWDHDRLEFFDPAALMADVALWLGLTAAIAGGCAWSRTRLATHSKSEPQTE